jgi:hypothetical protein
MSQDNGSATALLPTTALTAVSNGRPIKFTPERLEQIRNLVERGIKREEIAETIGVTLGSLQVTCSRLGISLRRSKLDLTTPTHHQNPLASVTQRDGHQAWSSPIYLIAWRGRDGMRHVRVSYARRRRS